MVYLKPRRVFESAIVNSDPVIYDFEKLIECLMTEYKWTYFESIDWYCYNIEHLKYKGLKIQGE